VPSGEKQTEVTRLVCAFKDAVPYRCKRPRSWPCCPRCCQMRLPSGEKHTEYTASVCPLRGRSSLPAGSIPDPGCFVCAPSHKYVCRPRRSRPSLRLGVSCKSQNLLSAAASQALAVLCASVRYVCHPRRNTQKLQESMSWRVRSSFPLIASRSCRVVVAACQKMFDHSERSSPISQELYAHAVSGFAFRWQHPRR